MNLTATFNPSVQHLLSRIYIPGLPGQTLALFASARLVFKTAKSTTFGDEEYFMTSRYCGRGIEQKAGFVVQVLDNKS